MFFIDHKKKRTTWKDPRFKDVNEPDDSELTKINNKTDQNCCRKTVTMKNFPFLEKISRIFPNLPENDYFRKIFEKL